MSGLQILPLLAGQAGQSGQSGEESAAAELLLWPALAALAAGGLLWWRWRAGAAATRWLLGAVIVALAALALPWPGQPRLREAAQAAWSQVRFAAREPLVWGVLLGAAALMLMLPPGGSAKRLRGAALGLISLGFFGAAVEPLGGLTSQAVFWILAAVTIGAAAAAVSMRSAVYAAIWFALSLLGTAGLFMYQGAQFLGVATVVVYAGAIVVTFLFVVMLAQPEGHATYDRVAWGSLPKPISVLAGAAMVSVLAYAMSAAGVDPAADNALPDRSDATADEILLAAAELQGDDGRPLISSDQLAGAEYRGPLLHVALRDVSPQQGDRVAAALSQALNTTVEVQRLTVEQDVRHPSHMARLGAVLFSRHLLSVEVAGAMLLVALVGAVAIAIAGKDADATGGSRP